MGAGARLAEERDRWPDDWRVAGLDQEGEHLLDLLDRAEELRAAVPGFRVPIASRHQSEGDIAGGTHASVSAWGRASQVRGTAPVLVGITDRRVLVVGRWPAADADQRPHEDELMTCVTALVRAGRDGRGSRLDLPGGDAELDLDQVALDRLWEHVDGPGDEAGVAEGRTQPRRLCSSSVTAAPSA